VAIVVIAVLSAISVAVYLSAVDDSRDTARRATVDQVVQAINALRFQKDGTINIGGYTASSGGIGSNGICSYTGGGWLYHTSSTYPCSMGAMLLEAKILDVDFFDKVPPNEEYDTDVPANRAAMMLHRCEASTARYLLYYYVKKPTAEEAASLDQLRSPSYCPQAISSISGSDLDTYKMKAAVEVKL